MQNRIFSIITPVFSVFMILQKSFSYADLLNYILYRWKQLWCIIFLWKTDMKFLILNLDIWLYYTVSDFTVTFDKYNASLLNKIITLLI